MIYALYRHNFMFNSAPIYLDHFATTPCDERVVAAMQPFWNQHFGNANSAHRWGARAADAVENAREQVAALIGAQPREVVWSSGATEADNLGVLGWARAAKLRGIPRRKIIVSAIEHKAVSSPCRALQDEGFEIQIAPVDGDGRVKLDALRELADESTLLIAIQAANSEIGTLQSLAEISQIAHHAGAVLHCDAAQAVGKIPVDVEAWEVDFLALSGHKLYAPKGIGALYARGGTRSSLQPLLYGGSRDALRPGTLPVPLIVALGMACHIAQQEMEQEAARLQQLRDEFEQLMIGELCDVRINGCQSARLPHGSSLTLSGVDAGALLANVPHLGISMGTACETGALSPSATLLALGLSRADAQSTVRVALGRSTQREQITRAAHDLIAAARHLRAMA